MIKSSNSENLKKIEKPWGYEIWWAETEKYAAKFLYINKNSRMSLQYHDEKEETVYVMSGVLRVWETKDDNNFKDYPPGSIYHVLPKKVHRFGAGFTNVTLCEVSTPELSDVIRLADDYKR